MHGKRMQGEREAKDAFRNSRIRHIGGKILETTEIVMRAVLFVVAILAVELCIVGLCYVACGRW